MPRSTAFRSILAPMLLFLVPASAQPALLDFEGIADSDADITDNFESSISNDPATNPILDTNGYRLIFIDSNNVRAVVISDTCTDNAFVSCTVDNGTDFLYQPQGSFSLFRIDEAPFDLNRFDVGRAGGFFDGTLSLTGACRRHVSDARHQPDRGFRDSGFRRRMAESELPAIRFRGWWKPIAGGRVRQLRA